MQDILRNMDEKKRDRIINSAIDEFSVYPFEKASTNNIVKNAGISKGLLFHYFGNKKELYECVIGFVVNKLYNEITSKIDWNETCIFERIKQLVFCKLELSKVYPNMFDFMLKIFTNEHGGSINDAIELYKKYGVDIQGVLSKIYTHNIDFTKFKDQNSIDKSINIVRWTIEKYTDEQIIICDGIQSIDFEKIVMDIDEYIYVLKKAIY